MLIHGNKKTLLLLLDIFVLCLPSCTSEGNSTHPNSTTATAPITTKVKTSSPTNTSTTTEQLTTTPSNDSTPAAPTTAPVTTTAPPTEDFVLVQLHVVFRHGDRSPVEHFPKSTDKQIKKDWPEGLGQLTETGEKQLFQLGKILRSSYLESENSTLPTDYKGANRLKIQVRTSQYHRCMMSATSLLAGMYPSSEASDKGDLPIEIVPVDYLPISEDYLLEASNACAAYSSERDAIMSSDAVKETETKYRNQFKIFANRTGWADFNLDKAWDTADILKCRELHELPNNPFNENDTALLMDIWGDQWKTLFNSSEHTGQVKYITGLLLRQIIGEMKNMTNATTTENTPSVMLYGAHDTNLAALLFAFNMSDTSSQKLYIPYSAYMTFELWKANNSKPLQHRLKIAYRHLPDMKKPFDFSKTKCDDFLTNPSCTVENLEKWTESLTYKDYAASVDACANSSSSSSITRDQIIAIVLGGLLLVVIIGGVACFLVRRRRGNGGYTHQVDE